MDQLFALWLPVISCSLVSSSVHLLSCLVLFLEVHCSAVLLLEACWVLDFALLLPAQMIWQPVTAAMLVAVSLPMMQTTLLSSPLLWNPILKKLISLYFFAPGSRLQYNYNQRHYAIPNKHLIKTFKILKLSQLPAFK